MGFRVLKGFWGWEGGEPKCEFGRERCCSGAKAFVSRCTQGKLVGCWKVMRCLWVSWVAVGGGAIWFGTCDVTVPCTISALPCHDMIVCTGGGSSSASRVAARGHLVVSRGVGRVGDSFRLSSAGQMHADVYSRV